MERAEIIGRKLRTLADAQQWFRDMHAAGMLFHPDDNPADVVESQDGSRTFALSEVPAVLARMREVRRMDWSEWGGHADCPCGWIMGVLDPFGVAA